MRDDLAGLVGGLRELRKKLGENHPLCAEVTSLQYRFAGVLAESHRAAACVGALRAIGETASLAPADDGAYKLDLPTEPEEQPPQYRDRLSAAAHDLTT